MDRSTKYCELTVRLRSGGRIIGKFHVPLRTSSQIRPSDALRECKDGFVTLNDSSIVERDQTRAHAVVLVPISSVEYIELSEGGWIANSPVDATSTRSYTPTHA